jgi:hypothetical protein
LIVLDQEHDDIPLSLTLQKHLAVVEVFPLITVLGTNRDVGKPNLETADEFRCLNASTAQPRNHGE